MLNIWIIGCGQFGSHAVRYLSKRNEEIHFILVDPNEKCLLQATGTNRDLKLADGVDFLKENLHRETGPDWIIPALPVHLAAEWCLIKLKDQGFKRAILPDEIKELLPNPMDGLTGDLYVSHADFRCPSDCEEPQNICKVTKKSRKRNMFEVIADIKAAEYQSLVIRSHQLGPGIGGYRPFFLFKLLEQIKQAESRLLVSTACRCHGIVTGIGRFP